MASMMKIQGTRRATSSTAKACWPTRAWADAMRLHGAGGRLQSWGAPVIHVGWNEVERPAAACRRRVRLVLI
ncbi:Hypothetical protein SMAX5B_003154 [Scophthalmus maximus]|uniref:Uncharacterized protein n=1 Tax=Scophthalmus maximus TaxID=52904 RepID=A0A2U9CX74_SCOMX|nr:Hypothetical protein SMAX5B_003154 [Scophthalmus maximus]